VSTATHDGWRFWAGVVIRLVGIFVAGLALILFFNEVMIPVLKGDVERIQRDHQPAEPADVASPPPGRESSPVQK